MFSQTNTAKFFKKWGHITSNFLFFLEVMFMISQGYALFTNQDATYSLLQSSAIIALFVGTILVSLKTKETETRLDAFVSISYAFLITGLWFASYIVCLHVMFSQGIENAFIQEADNYKISWDSTSTITFFWFLSLMFCFLFFTWQASSDIKLSVGITTILCVFIYIFYSILIGSFNISVEDINPNHYGAIIVTSLALISSSIVIKSREITQKKTLEETF